MLTQDGKAHKAKRKGKCGTYSYYFCLSRCSHRKRGCCRYLCSWHDFAFDRIDYYQGPRDDVGLITVYCYDFKA